MKLIDIYLLTHENTTHGESETTKTQTRDETIHTLSNNLQLNTYIFLSAPAPTIKFQLRSRGGNHIEQQRYVYVTGSTAFSFACISATYLCIFLLHTLPFACCLQHTLRAEPPSHCMHSNDLIHVFARRIPWRAPHRLHEIQHPKNVPRSSRTQHMCCCS